MANWVRDYWVGNSKVRGERDPHQAAGANIGQRLSRFSEPPSASKAKSMRHRSDQEPVAQGSLETCVLEFPSLARGGATQGRGSLTSPVLRVLRHVPGQNPSSHISARAVGCSARVFWSVSALAFITAAAAQQPKPINLRTAVEIALKGNPDVLLARLDEEKAYQSVREARAPFSPQLTLGSGLAYTNGIPQSVEGSSPAIVRAVGRQFLYNRAQSNRVKEARELEAAAGHSAEERRNEVAYRVASTYLDFESAWRGTKLLSDQAENLRRVEGVIAARVEEGRQLPLDFTRARLETARAEQQLEAGKAQTTLLEATLKHQLNLPLDAALEPQPTDFISILPLPQDQTEALGQAVASNPELKRIDAGLRAKGFALRAEKGALAPRIDLVAQYSLLGRFNNFEDYFNKFQRHNGQVGMSFQIPVFGRKEVNARAAKVLLETSALEIQRVATRSGIELEVRRKFEDIRQAESQQKLARLELDFARENLNVVLANHDEGRTSMEEIEKARLLENQSWAAYYDSQYTVQKAKLNLLRETGELVAALR